jgi:ATP-dependent DNA helicase RecQ
MRDLVMRQGMIADGGSPDEVKRIERAKLEALLGVCETVGCRRQALLAHFGEKLAEPCGNCDLCLDPAESFDGTVAAQKALSAMLRTGQRFGVGHLVDLLLGNATEKIERQGHDKLPTFGVGKELDRKAWSSVYRQLVVLGLVEVAHDMYGALHVTDAARPVLRGERQILLRRDNAAKVKQALRKELRAEKREQALGLDEASSKRFEALRAERMRLAKAQGVPPYVIFHDTTLLALAARAPLTMDDLAEIPGMGESKRQRYGEAMLAVLAEGG